MVRTQTHITPIFPISHIQDRSLEPKSAPMYTGGTFNDKAANEVRCKTSNCPWVSWLKIIGWVSHQF